MARADADDVISDGGHTEWRFSRAVRLPSNGGILRLPFPGGGAHEARAHG
jgi:hypothetical protein